MRSFVVLVLLAVLSFNLRVQLAAKGPRLTEAESRIHEVLYLPDGKALELISFGYRNLLSDVLWFNTISYFGKHYASDRNYEWLRHMCRLVNRLDPEKQFVYEFCSTMLAWEARDYDGSLEFLSRAIEAFPHTWRFHFLRGFTYMFFLDDSHRAQQDFAAAAAQSDAEPIAARLAARKMLDTSDPETAISFLETMLRSAKDQYQQKALLKRLREARYELDLRRLEQAIEIFTSQKSRAPANLGELLTAGIIPALPGDPFGGTYFYDQSSGTVRSTTGRKRLSLYQKKTAADLP